MDISQGSNPGAGLVCTDDGCVEHVVAAVVVNGDVICGGSDGVVE